MIMRKAWSAAVLVVMGGLAAGCSETGFQDFFGAGKYAPDETQVTANQPLAVPPDLQLRPPSDAPPPPQMASQPADGSGPQQDLALAPGSDEAPPPAAAEPYQPPQQMEPLPQETQQQQQASAEEPQDAYARWGVSRHHPDGRKKSQIELNAEMREKKLEAERRKDPNYGTIWNMGSIWSDG